MRQKFCLIVLLFFFFPCVLCIADPSVIVVDNPWLVLRAFLVSYPDKIKSVDYDPALNDWFLVTGDSRLYWAEGRLLPQEEMTNRHNWRPYVDYLYPEEIPDPATFSPEIISKLNATLIAEKRLNSVVYNTSFYDALYDGRTRVRIESHIQRIEYLGKRVSVHTSIIPKLRKIETHLNELAKTDEEVQTFISAISSIEGYNWREISDSPSRSNHSWGFAVDILPKNWGKKNIYWSWVSTWNEKWMLIPLTRRWMPPTAVIDAFEKEGFIWGGKWMLWDNMHFEYRPELVCLQKWGYKGDLPK